MTVLDTDGLVAVLRAQSQRYHDRHPFHQKMNAGGLSPHALARELARIAARLGRTARIAVVESLSHARDVRPNLPRRRLAARAERRIGRKRSGCRRVAVGHEPVMSLRRSRGHSLTARAIELRL